MRVGILTHAARAGDAIGRQVVAKVAYFRDQGAEVRVVVTTVNGLDPRLKPFTRRDCRQDRREIVGWLRGCDWACVEYTQHSPVFELLPLVAGGRPRIVFDYYGVTPPALGGASHRDALVRGAESRGLVWFADAAIVHSRASRQELIDATGYPSERIHETILPVDLESFTPGEPTSGLRDRLGLPADARLLLFVGRLAPNKRAPVLVEALAHLPPNVHAVFIGNCSDCYELERQRCRERAARAQVTCRVHFLGPVDEATLRDAYCDSDLLVIPSAHEGFCLPIVEAMASGLPVIAARATASPETLGDAGLTFRLDDPVDLARRAMQVLMSSPGNEKLVNKRIALVAPRFGDGFPGGAEASLRLLANRILRAGYTVEVFTIGDRDEKTIVDGLPVHRFRADPVDADRHAAAAHAITLGGRDEDAEAAFIVNLPSSAALLQALKERGSWQALFAGPYLSRLTFDVVESFGDRTVLVPCWHDEPFAQLRGFQAYTSVGGVLYHSPEEQTFAQATLGFNHPNCAVIGTLVDIEFAADARRGREQIGERYLLFAGRYCREKGLDRVISWVRRYSEDERGRFTFAFMGGGDALIPDEPWARDLGFVDNRMRSDVMAGADALVLLSPNESLSLALLEAQSLGVPAIVAAENAVLDGHRRRGAGCRPVADYAEFADALDDLWIRPDAWRELGRRGRDYVIRNFSDADEFDRRWQSTIVALDQPLAQQMRTKGFRRAVEFAMPRWREQFSSVFESALSQTRPSAEAQVEIRTSDRITVGRDCETTIVPVRMIVHGSLPILPGGPARAEFICRFDDTNSRAIKTPLASMVVPGRTSTAWVRVPVPDRRGRYTVTIQLMRGDRCLGRCTFPLRVGQSSQPAGPPSMSGTLQAACLAAESARQLPDGYVDVSLGRLARLKQWLKRKLLHNFQTAYVDVLSRQQSAFNKHVLGALAEIASRQEELAAAIRRPTRRHDKLTREQRRIAELQTTSMQDTEEPAA